MKQYLIIIGCSVFLMAQGHNRNTVKDKEIKGDSIKIVSVSPSMGFEDGAEYSLNVEVKYTLTTVDSGILMIGFNTKDVDSYFMLSEASSIIDKGSGVHNFKIAVRAKDWRSDGDFKVIVNLSENPHSSKWTPLASDQMTLNFKD